MTLFASASFFHPEISPLSEGRQKTFSMHVRKKWRLKAGGLRGEDSCALERPRSCSLIYISALPLAKSSNLSETVYLLNLQDENLKRNPVRWPSDSIRLWSHAAWVGILARLRVSCKTSGKFLLNLFVPCWFLRGLIKCLEPCPALRRCLIHI